MESSLQTEREPLVGMEEFMSNNVMGTVDELDGGSFNMLTYLDDTTLLNQLGLEPTTLTDDCHTKLLDSNTTDNYTELVPPPSQEDTNNYTELLAPSPQDGGGTCYSKLLDSSLNYGDLLPSTLPQQESCLTPHGETTYYTLTLDVEPPQVANAEGGATTSNTLLDTSGIALLNPIILSATPTAQDQQRLTTLNVSDSEQLGLSNNTSMVIHLKNNTSAVLTSPEEVRDSLSPVSNRSNGGDARQPRGSRKRQQTEKEEAAASATVVKPPPKRRRPKKEKKYEIPNPIEDPDEEKKRLNAINAKKNRDKKKNMLNELAEKVSAVTKERDNLRQEVEELKQREASLRNQLVAKYGVHWNGLDNFTIV